MPTIDLGVPPLSFDESTGFTAPAAFGAYRVLHQIGSGVLGPVFRTYEPQNDRLVAVKAFRLDIVPEQVARLADALRRLVAADLKHGAIVSSIDAGLEGTTAYLAMEYVAAETLDVAFRHLAPSPLDRALPILTQIAEAIDAAWAAGLGHGALHPRDIFVTTANNEVRVTGFGVVPALEGVGIKAPVRRPYAAPERGTDEPWDRRADVYSLGAIAHELLTKRRPAGPSEQDGALVTGTTPEQRVLIRRVLSAALAERPERRFATPAAFIAALDAIVRGEPPGPLPEGSDDGEVAAMGAPSEPAQAEVAPAATAAAEPPVVAVQAVVPPVAPRRPRAVTRVDRPATRFIESSQPPSDSAEAPPEAAHRSVEAFAPPVEPAAPRVETPVAHFAQEPAGKPHPAYLAARALAERTPQPKYPWSAVGAALLAGVALGLVGGYRIGLGRVGGESTPLVAIPQVKPNDTEVMVPPPPVASPATPPPADVTAPTPANANGGASPPASANVPAAKVAAPPPTVGRLLVRSVPAGASVAIDGRTHGQTPATIRDLSFGSHTLVVSRPGYTSYTEKLTLSADQPARNVTIELKPVKTGRGSSRSHLSRR